MRCSADVAKATGVLSLPCPRWPVAARKPVQMFGDATGLLTAHSCAAGFQVRRRGTARTQLHTRQPQGGTHGFCDSWLTVITQ